ncbi:MAG TPA: type I methionyl aminopeptidase [Chloroflexota bacterium]|nr:type I methionyl aminopeptidase [Chloroflexota bacterium]
MGVIVKSPQHIARLRDSGRLVAETYEVLREHVVPGVTTADLDRIAEEYITRHGAKPVYKGYNSLPASRNRPARPAFPASICVAINEVICHGIPSRIERLKEGDIIGIDIGVVYNGWVGDACVTFPVGRIDAQSRRLLEVTRRSLALSIEQCYPGNQLGDIGAAIQTYAESQGFSVVYEYVGHGVGRLLHEEPNVPHVGKPGTGLELKVGMVFTIEPMINAGAAETRLLPDGWTITTADGKRSAQFEHQIAITENGPEILTRL